MGVFIRRLVVNFKLFGVNFWPQGVAFVFEIPIEFIFGALRVDFGPLRGNIRAMHIGFWHVEGEFWLW